MKDILICLVKNLGSHPKHISGKSEYYGLKIWDQLSSYYNIVKVCMGPSQTSERLLGFVITSYGDYNTSDLGQKTSAATGFVKTTETLGKKPHITLTKPQFLRNAFKKPCNPWKSLNFSKKSSKINEIFIKSPNF
jgi:hypothetical protein